MKLTVNIARVLVGVLFIFSGLVKAIDPLGLAYKMQEFFDAWRDGGHLPGLMNWLNVHALLFSVIMITLEVTLGVALLLGIWKKLTAWLLLLLMLFFTFLTSYVLFTDKIRACGCFGDCIPLTPMQTFTKDIILLLLVILILVKLKYIMPVFSNKVNILIKLAAVAGVIFLQWYVLRHLPIKDCLPYKVGNNILELRKTPKDATYDKYAYTYFYKKADVEKEFGEGQSPDSTWTLGKVASKKLIEKGNGKTALINDFVLQSPDGDTTEELLSQNAQYYLLFIKTMDDYPSNWDKDIQLITAAQKMNRHIYIVTPQPDSVRKRFEGKLSGPMPSIFTADVTAIKAAARANPTVFLMDGPVVKGKWSWADFGEATKE